jgi:hypothetical protein
MAADLKQTALLGSLWTPLWLPLLLHGRLLRSGAGRSWSVSCPLHRQSPPLHRGCVSVDLPPLLLRWGPRFLVWPHCLPITLQQGGQASLGVLSSGRVVLLAPCAPGGPRRPDLHCDLWLCRWFVERLGKRVNQGLCGRLDAAAATAARADPAVWCAYYWAVCRLGTVFWQEADVGLGSFSRTCGVVSVCV